MNSLYFYNGRPIISKIINEILLLSREHQFYVEAIAMVGGWARAVRESGFGDAREIANPIDLQAFIDKSLKYGGDIDFILFVNEMKRNWKSILFKPLNADILLGEKDGRIDIVISLPAEIRHPGIQISASFE